jgi:hypothetical protein
MSASVIGALRVNLGLDSAQFEKGAKRSQNTLKTMRTQFTAIAGAAAAMGAALSAAALKGAAEIDKAAKSARRLDSSIGGFRALELAAGEAGVSLSTLTDAVQTMDREVAKGSKAAGEALRTLNLSARDLEGIDADEKMAVVADSIEKMGLTTAQTSVVLQQLGVRNREMVLAVGAGGGIFRSARADIEDYGLAISSVDSDRIEAANDAIGRLGLIGQYAGQQLAIALVPAMGRLAQVMTDSLREGGLLRGLIDGLVGNLDVLATATGAAVLIMGTRYVAAMVAASGATVSFSGAVAVARGAIVALTGPIGLLYGAIGLAAAGFISYRNATEKANEMSREAVEAASVLGTELGILSANDLPAVTAKTVDLANANLTLARSAYAAAEAQMAVAQANAQAGFDQMSMENMSLPGWENPGNAIYEKRLKSLGEAATSLRDAQAELNAKVMEGEKVKVEATEVVAGLTDRVSNLGDAAGGAGKGLKGTKDNAKDLAKELGGPLSTAVDGVANAFGDFLVNGFKDFKSFARSILDSFKGMISQMIATAARNRIMLSIGGGGSVAGTAAQAAGGGGGILGGLFGGGGGGGGLLGGILGIGGGGGALGGLGAGLGGILSGGGLGASFANLGGLLSGSVSGLGAIGAALPALGLIAAPFAIAAAFKKKKTLLDSGLDVAVNGTRTNAKSFQTINTKRFFGLSSKTRTNFSAADPAIGQAVGDMQGAVRTMAESLGVGAKAFKGFSYSFKLSLKDMSSDQAAQAVAAEVAKLGDAFAGMIPHIRSMNELVAATQERYQLETRLLQLQGDTAALRARELDSVNHYNRALLEQIFALEDAAAVVAAFTQNANNFVSRQEQIFAATSGGFRETIEQSESNRWMQEIVRAIREGDTNTARLLTEQVRMEQRRELDPLQ